MANQDKQVSFVQAFLYALQYTNVYSGAPRRGTDAGLSIFTEPWTLFL